jgi:hypothetical protein
MPGLVIVVIALDVVTPKSSTTEHRQFGIV